MSCSSLIRLSYFIIFYAHLLKFQVLGKALCFGNIFLLSIFSYSSFSYADVEGIPYNSDFPNAQYPYAQAPDGCSGLQSTREVRDTWGPVDFTDACNNHDRCFYTLGSNWNTCNTRFLKDLNEACRSDLRIWVPPVTVGGVVITPGFYTPPEPTTLLSCFNITSIYYGGVQAGVLLGVFNDAQNKQRRYEQWVAGVRNRDSLSYRKVQHQRATGKLIDFNGDGRTDIFRISTIRVVGA